MNSELKKYRSELRKAFNVVKRPEIAWPVDAFMIISKSAGEYQRKSAFPAASDETAGTPAIFGG